MECKREADLDKALRAIMQEHGFVRPDRGAIPGPDKQLRYGKPPDYRVADLLYFKGKTQNHKPGSLEKTVENLVKKWEMEATHLPDIAEWTTIDHENYTVQSNGGKIYSSSESCKQGNYNWLLEPVSKELYDCEKYTFEDSHSLFRDAFVDGFPWEVLKVFSGPPTVTFTWRHWGLFNGEFKGRRGDGEVYELYGFAVVDVTENLKISTLRIYYNPDEYLEALYGMKDASELVGGKSLLGQNCCPFQK